MREIKRRLNNANLVNANRLYPSNFTLASVGSWRKLDLFWGLSISSTYKLSIIEVQCRMLYLNYGSPKPILLIRSAQLQHKSYKIYKSIESYKSLHRCKFKNPTRYPNKKTVGIPMSNLQVRNNKESTILIFITLNPIDRSNRKLNGSPLIAFFTRFRCMFVNQ